MLLDPPNGPFWFLVGMFSIKSTDEVEPKQQETKQSDTPGWHLYVLG